MSKKNRNPNKAATKKAARKAAQLQPVSGYTAAVQHLLNLIINADDTDFHTPGETAGVILRIENGTEETIGIPEGTVTFDGWDVRSEAYSQIIAKHRERLLPGEEIIGIWQRANANLFREDGGIDDIRMANIVDLDGFAHTATLWPGKPAEVHPSPNLNRRNAGQLSSQLLAALRNTAAPSCMYCDRSGKLRAYQCYDWDDVQIWGGYWQCRSEDEAACQTISAQRDRDPKLSNVIHERIMDSWDRVSEQMPAEMARPLRKLRENTDRWHHEAINSDPFGLRFRPEAAGQ